MKKGTPAATSKAPTPSGAKSKSSATRMTKTDQSQSGPGRSSKPPTPSTSTRKSSVTNNNNKNGSPQQQQQLALPLGELGSVVPLCGSLWRVLFKGPVFFSVPGAGGGPYLGMERIGSVEGEPQDVSRAPSTPPTSSDGGNSGLMMATSLTQEIISLLLNPPTSTPNLSPEEESAGGGETATSINTKGSGAGYGPDGVQYFKPSLHATGAVLIPFKAIELEVQALKQCQQQQQGGGSGDPPMRNISPPPDAATGTGSRGGSGKRSSSDPTRKSSGSSSTSGVMVAGASSLLRGRGDHSKIPLDAVVPSPMIIARANQQTTSSSLSASSAPSENPLPLSGRRHRDAGLDTTLPANAEDDGFGAWGSHDMGGGGGVMQSRPTAISAPAGPVGSAHSGGTAARTSGSGVTGSEIARDQENDNDDDLGPREGVCLGFRPDPQSGEGQGFVSGGREMRQHNDHRMCSVETQTERSSSFSIAGSVDDAGTMTDSVAPTVTDATVVPPEDEKYFLPYRSGAASSLSIAVPPQRQHNYRTGSMESLPASDWAAQRDEWYRSNDLPARTAYPDFAQDHSVAQRTGTAISRAKEDLVKELASSVLALKRQWSGMTKDEDAVQLLKHRYPDVQEEGDFLKSSLPFSSTAAPSNNEVSSASSDVKVGWSSTSLAQLPDAAPKSRNSNVLGEFASLNQGAWSALQYQLPSISLRSSSEKGSSSVTKPNSPTLYEFRTSVQDALEPLLKLLGERPQLLPEHMPSAMAPQTAASSSPNSSPVKEERKGENDKLDIIRRELETGSEVEKLLHTAEAAEEQVRRRRFNVEEIFIAQQQAAADGEVEKCEGLVLQKTDELKLAQAFLVQALEPFPTVLQEFVDQPRAALQEMVRDTNKRLCALKEQFQDVQLQKLQAEKEQLVEGWKESREGFYRANIRVTQDLAEAASRWTDAKEGCTRSWQSLTSALSDLVGHRRQQQLALEDIVTLAEDKRELISEQCRTDQETLPKLEKNHHQTLALQEALRVLDGTLLTPLAKTALKETIQVQPDSLSSLVFLEEKNLMHLQTILFESQMKLGETHQSLWRDLCLHLGELEWKKGRSLKAIQDRIYTSNVAVEVAGETLDGPSAKEHALQRDELQKLADAITVEVEQFSVEMSKQEEVFELTSKPLLLVAGKIPTSWTPRLELLELNHGRDAKMGKIQQELLTAAQLEGDG